ncbi:MAG: SDR family oxidoreductase [Thermaerobacter sp.]|nr:SDR family oxidoreductase [Thermaerobacter sp.]
MPDPSSGGRLRRSALITGGVEGLGRSVAQALLADGYAVTATHRASDERAQVFSDEARRLGWRLQVLQANAGKTGDVERSVAAHMEEFGAPWALVHAAGPFLVGRRDLVDTPQDEAIDMVEGNLIATLLYATAVLPHMRRAGGGRVIVFGFDRAGDLPAWAGRSAYAAAKTGVLSLAKTLAVEEAAHRITVNAICPGDIRDPLKEGTIAQAREGGGVQAPVGRSGSGEDVARIVQFFLAEDSDFLTGNIVYVTGGLDVLGASKG